MADAHHSLQLPTGPSCRHAHGAAWKHAKQDKGHKQNQAWEQLGAQSSLLRKGTRPCVRGQSASTLHLSSASEAAAEAGMMVEGWCPSYNQSSLIPRDTLATNQPLLPASTKPSWLLLAPCFTWQPAQMVPAQEGRAVLHPLQTTGLMDHRESHTKELTLR